MIRILLLLLLVSCSKKVEKEPDYVDFNFRSLEYNQTVHAVIQYCKNERICVRDRLKCIDKVTTALRRFDFSEASIQCLSTEKEGYCDCQIIVKKGCEVHCAG